MKSVNGVLLIMLGGIVVWIGATGRLPALIAALGIVRATPPKSGTKSSTSSAAQGTPDVGASSHGSSTTASDLNLPASSVWTNGLKIFGGLPSPFDPANYTFKSSPSIMVGP